MAIIFKVLEAAERRWRRLNGYRLVPLVRVGARFVNGERSTKGTKRRKPRNRSPIHNI